MLNVDSHFVSIYNSPYQIPKPSKISGSFQLSKEIMKQPCVMLNKSVFASLLFIRALLHRHQKKTTGGDTADRSAEQRKHGAKLHFAHSSHD